MSRADRRALNAMVFAAADNPGARQYIGSSGLAVPEGETAKERRERFARCDQNFNERILPNWLGVRYPG